MTKFIGERYTETRDLTTVQVAALIRQDIKKQFPNLKIFVRSEYYSGGSSIDIRVKSCDFNPINPAWDPNDYMTSMDNNPRYTERGKTLLRDLERIVNRYNRDNSDSSIDYFDVRFYSSVTYDYAFEQEKMRELGITVRP